MGCGLADGGICSTDSASRCHFTRKARGKVPVMAISNSGFLLAAALALTVTAAAEDLTVHPFPYGPTIDQFVKVVVAYIEARPARMHEQFEGLTLEALRAAWPCR